MLKKIVSNRYAHEGTISFRAVSLLCKGPVNISSGIEHDFWYMNNAIEQNMVPCGSTGK
jgi:hypothetical protein